MAHDPKDRIGPFQATKTFTDDLGNFEGQIIHDPIEIERRDSKTAAAKSAQLLSPLPSGGAAPAPERTETENRLVMAKAAVQAESAADQGGEGFRFTDIFDILGSMASDKTIAADSLGRLIGKATGEPFRDSEQREQAKALQKQQATQAMGLLLEQGRDRRATNRLDFTKEKFGENKELRKQDREIAKERIDLATSQGERLKRQAGLDQLDREADNDALQDMITVGARELFKGSSAKAIAEKLEISKDAALSLLKEIDAMPSRNDEEKAAKAAAVKAIAERFSPSGRESEPQSEPEPQPLQGLQRLPSGALFNPATGLIEE